jgi:hypothetical protein
MATFSGIIGCAVIWLACGLWSIGRINRDKCSTEQEYEHLKRVAVLGGIASLLILSVPSTDNNDSEKE